MKKRSKQAVREAESRRKAVMVLFEAVKARPGPWVRQWRLDHNCSQEVLAAALGVSSRTIKRYEQSESVPKILVLALEGK